MGLQLRSGYFVLRFRIRKAFVGRSNYGFVTSDWIPKEE